MTTQRQDQLLQYILKPEDERDGLPDKLREQYHRIVMLVGLMSQHRITRDVIDIYMKLQKDNGSRISQSQAYRDLEDARYVVGEMESINKKFERVAMANWQKEVMKKAVEMDDIRGFNAGMANIIKILGLDRNDPSPIDYTKLQPVRPLFGFYPELFTHDDLPSDEDFLATIEELSRPKKYRKVSKHVEDIDHTEVHG